VFEASFFGFSLDRSAQLMENGDYSMIVTLAEEGKLPVNTIVSVSINCVETIDFAP
jgi:hypothetical protein